MMDPWELPGLAHFCEHMLFLGTDKYPSENEYFKFISNHGGLSNAFTSSDHTNYHFDVAPDYLSVGTFIFNHFSKNMLLSRFINNSAQFIATYCFSYISLGSVGSVRAIFPLSPIYRECN